MKNIKRIVCGLGVLLQAACSSGGSSYSILPTGQGFKQSTSAVVNDTIDILWVIDNSGSMSPLQINLTNNFNSFINQFQSKGYNFHIGVTTTDAYRAGANFFNNSNWSKFRDGVGSQHTGIFVILPTTLNLIPTFVTNAKQGASGSGDERAFSSLKAALSNPFNSSFLRSNSFLSVIILSDEDDFSDPTRDENSWQYMGGMDDHSYTNPGLESVDSYVSYLDTLTNSTPEIRRYNVSAISVLDNDCLADHIADSSSAIVGQRYMEFANKTNGVLGSICDSSYADALISIQKSIVELGTQFYLDRAPIVSSITVHVDGASVFESAVNGWTYNSAANSLIFHGSAIPGSGASIQVDFDPVSLNF